MCQLTAVLIPPHPRTFRSFFSSILTEARKECSSHLEVLTDLQGRGEEGRGEEGHL
jgi:hypothetical protein